ncbi:MAG TPA: DUF998 domain-containing protein [Vicinamibacterales bacterium]|nr:DUF998 domain-containing protein [Vicinamibacterales bacterium]
MQRTVARVLNAAGIAAPMLWVSALVYIGSLRPEYSHSRQYISELAARGTPTQHLMQVAGFILPGLMVVAFGVLVGLSSHTTLAGAGAALLIVGGIARVTAGVFPIDPCCAPMAASFSERLHNAAGATYVLATSAAVLIWCLVSERTFRTRVHWFRWYSLATFVAAITLPWWLIRFGTDPASVGLFQRASFGALNLWALVFALVVWSSRLSWRDSWAPF